jgi:competence protein ComEC
VENGKEPPGFLGAYGTVEGTVRRVTDYGDSVAVVLGGARFVFAMPGETNTEEAVGGDVGDKLGTVVNGPDGGSHGLQVDTLAVRLDEDVLAWMTARDYALMCRSCSAENDVTGVGSAVNENAAGGATGSEGAAYDGGTVASGEGQLRIGMKMQVEGKLKWPRQATNPGEFDMYTYERSVGVGYQVSSKWAQVADRRYDPYLDGLSRLRERFRAALRSICADEDLGLLEAMLLGDRTDLDPQVQKAYRDNGIAHLLAISGLHITFLGMGLFRLLRRCGLGYGISGMLGALVMVSYGILTGSSATVVRAVIMFLAQVLGAYLGRTYDRLSALSLAGVLLLLYRPILMIQASFQLSFGAVFAVGVLSPWVWGVWEARGKCDGKYSAKCNAKYSAHCNGRRAFGSAAKICQVTERGERNAKDSRRWLRLAAMAGKVVCASVCFHLVTFPIVVYHFFYYPTYGAVLNLFVIPLAGYLMLSAVLGACMALVSVTAGIVAMGAGHYILRFYELLCGWFGALPHARVLLGRPAMWQIGVYYGVLALGLGAVWVHREMGTAWLREKMGAVWVRRGMDAVLAKWTMGGMRNTKMFGGCAAGWRSPALPGWCGFRMGMAVGAAVFVVAGFFAMGHIRPTGMSATFLDVGQGDGIFLETQGLRVLVDGGSSDAKNVGEKRLEPFLLCNRVDEVDYAIVSHGDADHTNGLKYLLGADSDVYVRHLVLPARGRGDEVYEKLESLAMENGTDVCYMNAGDSILGPAAEIACIYPYVEEDATVAASYRDRNEDSLVLDVGCGGTHLLLTGDMSGSGEGELLADAGRSEALRGELAGVDVLKVAHHGSRFSTTPEWIDLLSPTFAVISCGADNSYGHPHPATLQVLAAHGVTVLETMESGAVTLRDDGKRLWWERFRGG